MNGNKPDLTLSMDDKIYLAVAKNISDKLSFVYTLACHKAHKNLNQYNLLPKREIHAFKDSEVAKLYHDTIAEIVNINSENKRLENFFSINEDVIAQFLENSR